MDRILEFIQLPHSTNSDILVKHLRAILDEFIPALQRRPSTFVKELFSKNSAGGHGPAREFAVRLVNEYIKEGAASGIIEELLCKIAEFGDFKVLLRGDRRLSNALLLKLVTEQSLLSSELVRLIDWPAITEDVLLEEVLEKIKDPTDLWSDAMSCRYLAQRLGERTIFVSNIVKQVSQLTEPVCIMNYYVILLRICPSCPLFCNDNMDSLVRIGLSTLIHGPSTPRKIAADFFSTATWHSQTRDRMLFWYRKGLLDKIFGQLNSSDLAQNCDLLELILSVADEIRMASVPKLQISSCNMLIRCLNGFGQESAVALRILLKLCESTLIDQNDLATFDMEVACLIDDPSRILTYDLANDEAGSVAQLIEYGEIRRFGSSGQYDQQFTKFKSQLQLLNYKRIPSNNAQSDQALLAKIISLCAHLKQSRTIEDIEQLIEENERLKTKVGDITVEMEMNAHDFAEFRASFNREMDISKQDIETLKKTCETLKSDLDALHSQHFELQNDRNRLAADLNVINSQFADSIEKLRGLQAELDREKNATLAFHVKAQITEDDMVNLQNELAKREIELLKRDNEIQILNENIQKSNQMGDRLQSLVDGLQAENLKLSDSNEQFIREAKIRSTAERLEKTKLFAQHEETIGQLQVRINQLQMELETKALCERNLKSDMKIAASCIEQKDRTNQQLSSELQQLLEELQRGRKCDPHQMDEENMADFSNLSLDIDLK